MQLKIYNFVSIDPSADTVGMTRGGRGDQAVWDEFAGDTARLAQVAQAIRDNLDAVTPEQAAVEEDDVAEAPEGRLLTRVHRVRERNRPLVKKKKAAAVAATGTLACEVCSFDFAAVYGQHGDGFIECHHTVPLYTLRPGSRTRLPDLALVCANCHPDDSSKLAVAHARGAAGSSRERLAIAQLPPGPRAADGLSL